MKSDPQLFSWPGSPLTAGNHQPQPGLNPVEPAQAAADAAAAGHQQGFDRGYAEGLAKGEQEAQAQAERQFANIESIFQEAETFTAQWRSAQVGLVQLVSARFLLQELVSDTDRLDQLLKQGQQLLPTAEDFTLACHPDIEAALGKQAQYSLVVDPQLPPGALELRQGCSCLQLNLEEVVAQAFANLDKILDQDPSLPNELNAAATQQPDTPESDR